MLVWEVTDRVASQQRRDQMLALLDVLIGHAPIAARRPRPRAAGRRINEVLAAANGRSVAEHLGRPLPEVIPGIAGVIEPVLRRVLETGDPVIDAELETHPLPTDPHRRRHWKISYYPVLGSGAGGPIDGVGVIVTDETQHVEAERERARLHEAERTARATAERAQRRLDLLARPATCSAAPSTRTR